MEIALLAENTLRIKGKKSTLLFDVLDTTKIEANAYLFLMKDHVKAKQDKSALLIAGPGEYEVSGTKVSGFKTNSSLLYQLTIDGMSVLISSASAFSRMKDKVSEQNIVVLFADEMIDQAALTNAQPTLVVCYGDKAAEVSANLGKGLNKKTEDAQTQPDATIKPTDKIVMTVEKLPTELQIALLA